MKITLFFAVAISTSSKIKMQGLISHKNKPMQIAEIYS
jgi:hypothetical protein